MHKQDRVETIFRLLADKTFVPVPEIIDATGTSRATIYRDLGELEAQGQLLITRGSITKAPQRTNDALKRDRTVFQKDDPYELKVLANRKEKQKIAEAACKLLEPNMTVFLDSSTTVYDMCKGIAAIGNVYVVTNDIYIAGRFRDHPTISVYVLGGQLRRGYNTLTDPFTSKNSIELTMDIAFIGCDGVSPQRGITIANNDEVMLKRDILGASAKTVLLCDHTKLGRNAYFTVAMLEEIDSIITGNVPVTPAYTALQEAGANITAVDYII